MGNWENFMYDLSVFSTVPYTFMVKNPKNKIPIFI